MLRKRTGRQQDDEKDDKRMIKGSLLTTGCLQENDKEVTVVVHNAKIQSRRKMNDQTDSIDRFLADISHDNALYSEDKSSSFIFIIYLHIIRQSGRQLYHYTAMQSYLNRANGLNLSIWTDEEDEDDDADDDE